ncbi:MAG: hypothetical protein M3N56_04550, partial [Actinomycetota bacterium]|nr:hypothetical protein [Actinomycetota bacterium]
RGLGALGAEEPAHVQLTVLDVDCDVAGRERAIERGDALIEIAAELLEALIGGCGQPEHAPCGVAAH